MTKQETTHIVKAIDAQYYAAQLDAAAQALDLSPALREERDYMRARAMHWHEVYVMEIETATGMEFSEFMDAAEEAQE